MNQPPVSAYLKAYKPQVYRDQREPAFMFWVAQSKGASIGPQGIRIELYQNLAGPMRLSLALFVVGVLRRNSLPEHRHAVQILPAWQPLDSYLEKLL